MHFAHATYLRSESTRTVVNNAKKKAGGAIRPRGLEGGGIDAGLAVKGRAYIHRSDVRAIISRVAHPFHACSGVSLINDNGNE